MTVKKWVYIILSCYAIAVILCVFVDYSMIFFILSGVLILAGFILSLFTCRCSNCGKYISVALLQEAFKKEKYCYHCGCKIDVNEKL